MIEYWLARRRIKPEFHDADTNTDIDTDVLARILADTSDTRDFLSYSYNGKLNDTPTFRDDPRQDVGVGVRVGAVECQVYSTKTADDRQRRIIRMQLSYKRTGRIVTRRCHSSQPEAAYRNWSKSNTVRIIGIILKVSER